MRDFLSFYREIVAMKDPREFDSQRFEAMSERELLDVLAHRDEYTQEALRRAEQEVDRRGGEELLRRRTAVPPGPSDVPKARGRHGSRFFPRLWAWLVPARERFERYPELRLVVCALRVLALVVLLVLCLLVLAFPVFAFLPLSGTGFPLLVLLVALLYSGILLVAWLALQGGILILVDIERNTRGMREWVTGNASEWSEPTGGRRPSS